MRTVFPKFMVKRFIPVAFVIWMKRFIWNSMVGHQHPKKNKTNRPFTRKTAAAAAAAAVVATAAAAVVTDPRKEIEQSVALCCGREERIAQI